MAGNNLTEVGEKIKYFRKKSKLTQKALAEILEVTTVTIQNYENNRRKPSVNMLEKIATALNIPVVFLFDATRIVNVNDPELDVSVKDKLKDIYEMNREAEIMEEDFRKYTEPLTNKEEKLFFALINYYNKNIFSNRYDISKLSKEDFETLKMTIGTTLKTALKEYEK